MLTLALVLVASAVADDLSCPFNSKGKHPKCICNDDKPYDAVNRICATVLDAEYLLAKCPKGITLCAEIHWITSGRKFLFEKKTMIICVKKYFVI